MTLINYEQILQGTSKLSLSEQLQLLEALTRLVRRRIEEPRKYSIMELEGLGAEVWQGMDAQEYVNQERSEWDS
jgi:hypothetical protein